MVTQSDLDWVPAEITATNDTAFRAMDAKINPAPDPFGLGIPPNVSESLVVSSSPAVTMVTGDTQPSALSSEPLQLYSGSYAE